MNPLGKLMKVLLAVAVAAFMVVGARALAKDVAKEETKAKAPAARVVELSVTEKGFTPTPVKVKKGEPLKLVVTRKTDHTCATEIVLKEHGINTPLPLGKAVEVSFTPQKDGQLKYGCAMGMMISGVLLVE